MPEKITILVDKDDWWKLTECGWESTGKYAPVDGRLIMVRREANARPTTKVSELFHALAGINDSATDGREVPEWLEERLVAIRPLLAEVEEATHA